MEKRIREYVKETMKEFRGIPEQRPEERDLRHETRDLRPKTEDSKLETRDLIVRNEKVLSRLAKAGWFFDKAEKAMQNTEERLNERTDLTQAQKERIAKVLNTYEGAKIWNKQSLTPDGRIATARLLAGERDPEQVLKEIPRLEQDVIRATLRESGRDRDGNFRQRGKGFER